MRKDDIRNWTETETEKERTVSYDTDRAHITVHIPKRTPEQQERYEKTVRAALRRFYHHVTVEQGCDWEAVSKPREDLCSQLHRTDKEEKEDGSQKREAHK